MHHQLDINRITAISARNTLIEAYRFAATSLSLKIKMLGVGGILKNGTAAI